MERVSPTAAALLRLDAAGQHDAGWLARLDAHDGPLDLPALLDAIAARIAHLPRLRQVPVLTHGALRELVWEEDPHFDVARHVLAWPEAVGGEEEVRGIIDAFLAERLERDRPLWRVLVVPSTRSGGAAIVGKAHRALTDGDDATLLRELVFDPLSASSAGRAADDALALDEFRASRRMHALGARHGREADRIGATLRRVALARTAGPLTPAPASFLGSASGARTTLVTARVDLARVTRIAAHTGATVHDVVLAVAAGTLRRLALAGGDPDPASVRALVPMSLGEDELLGDAPCAVLELPIGERRAARRLTAVRTAMDAALERARNTASQPATDRQSPTVLAGPPDELASRLELGARVCNLTIPSARGPERARRVGGVRVRALFPISPVPETHALALGTLSYDRHLHVSATADTDAVTAIRRLPVMLVDAVEELTVSTGVRGAGRWRESPPSIKQESENR